MSGLGGFEPTMTSGFGISVGGYVHDWAFGEGGLVPDELERLGALLDEAAAHGTAWVRARSRSLTGVVTTIEDLPGLWSGPNADAFIGGFEDVQPSITGVDDPLLAAYAALEDLGVEARLIANAARDIEDLVRSRAESVGDSLTGSTTSWGLTVLDTIGVISDDSAETVRRALDELDRARTEATDEMEALGRRWDDALDHTARTVQQAIDALQAATWDRPPALCHPETRPDTIRDDLQRRWIASIVEPRILAAGDDPTALADLWRRLARPEKDALIKLRPDLIAKFLLPHLSAEEELDFHAANKHLTGEQALELAGSLTVPVPALPLLHVDVEGKFEARVTFGSDGTVDVLLSTTAAVALGLGLKGIVSVSAGKQERLGVTVRFASRDEYERAMAALRDAVRQDAADPPSGRTAQVLAATFAGTEEGFQRARGSQVALQGTFAVARHELTTSASLTVGDYYNGIKDEQGMFFTGKATVAAGQLTGQTELDGRLYVKTQENDRPYARITLTASGKVGGSLLEGTGFTSEQVATLKLDAAMTGRATITITTEASNANRGHLETLVRDLASGHLDPAVLGRLHAGSEVTIATTTGTEASSGTPDLRLRGAQAAVKATTTETTTIRSFRKTPDGTYYEQTAP